MKEYDVKPKRSNSKRYQCLLCLLFLLVIGAVAVSVVALVRQLNDEDNNDENTKGDNYNIRQTTTDSPKTGTTTEGQFDTRQDSVVECPIKQSATENMCGNTEGCEWHGRNIKEKTPPCVLTDNVGYVLDGQIQVSEHKWTARLKRTGIQRVYGMDVYQNINIDVEMFNENALRVYMYPDKSKNAWEIPDEALKMDIPTRKTNKLYNVTFVTTPIFGVVLYRILDSENKTKVFDTTVPGTIFSKQFMQITTRLSSEHVYGFGEHNHRRFKHDMNWKTWPIFTRDVAPVDEWNLYGAHPVYLNLEEDGNANMVFLKNSHAMDVVLQSDPHPAITYKVIGGVLDFYLFLGPSPQEAVQQYISAVGKPLMPPYWSLGFHLCKWGYENISVVEDVVERTREAEIPQDVQWGDIDYMYKKYVFTYDKTTFKGLPEFVNELHRNGQKYVVIVDPGIGANETIVAEAEKNSPGYNMYHDGLNMDAYVKTYNDSVLYSKVWPGLTVYPDFTNINNTLPYWIKYIKYFYETEGVEIDGLWIDMNEPANFVQGSIDGCRHNNLNYPPYVPHILDGDKENLYYKTVCMDSKQHWGNHYAVHSLYGHAESIVTYRALTSIWNKTRPFIMTRSSFAGTGKYSFKWLGDNQSQWRQIPWSIIGMLEFSMFGFPMIGADICGFWFAAQYEMCIRWTQLGAFYPFSRNHNAQGWPHQDPAFWGEAFASIARRALHIRYKILPYMYTQFHLAHTTASMFARPLAFEFPTDTSTRNIDRQFLLGPAFLVTPVLEKGKTSVEGYFPKQRWYNYYDGEEFMETGKHITVNAPLSIIPLHLRGGYILPTQEPANTTKYSRLRPMGLIVALNEDTTASGELFWDDGESIDSVERGEFLKATITATKGKYLHYNVVHNGYDGAKSLVINTIELYGLFGVPERVIKDNSEHPWSSVRLKNKIVELNDLQLNITQNHTISWEFF